MNTKINSIKKLSKILHLVLLITAIMFVMAIVAQIVLMVLAPSLDLSNISYIGVFGNIPFDGGIHELRAALLSEIMSAGVVTAILYIASYLFRDISREDSPFTKKNVKKLKIISVLMLALSVVVQPLSALINLIILPDVNIHIFLRLEQLIFSAVFICLALIFEYGAELQQQSDETL
ncbi:MAG: DUF2975 domain-containing protein [Oscillospiraceae bacterium]|nr:DUF2975 domain-containing protein [Oscillospiraceae bacterium]